MDTEQLIAELQRLNNEVRGSKIEPGLRREVFQGLIDIINHIVQSTEEGY